MKYTVVWRKEAEAQLAALWIRAVDQAEMTSRADEIDRALERDPHGAGESRNEGTRLAFFRPLAVRFRVDDAQMAVTVMSVRWVGR